MSSPTPAYYDAEIGSVKADPYRICIAYGITDPCQQHAVKKLLRAGCASKPLKQEIEEVIATLYRWLEMMEEDE